MAGVRIPQFTLGFLFALTAACAGFCGFLHWTGRDALALGVMIALLIVFVPVPLAFVASVAIDGWRPTAARWKTSLPLVAGAMLLALVSIAVFLAIAPSELRMFF